MAIIFKDSFKTLKKLLLLPPEHIARECLP